MNINLTTLYNLGRKYENLLPIAGYWLTCKDLCKFYVPYQAVHKVSFRNYFCLFRLSAIPQRRSFAKKVWKYRLSFKPDRLSTKEAPLLRSSIRFIFSLIFLFGFGEEISWGQRIFNWSTSEGYSNINRQNETNIHNLVIFRGLFDFNHLFTYFWFATCIVVPIADFKWNIISKWLSKINFPIIPIWLGSVFFLNYSISLIMKASASDLMKHSVVEMKEACIIFLFMVASINFMITGTNPKISE